MSIKLPDGYGHIALGQTDSTLDEARRRFAALPGPTWITATQQTAARGRRGRVWQMPAGNFAATLVLTCSQEDAALRSFVAALALYETCVEITGNGASLALKWPNDVLLNEGKLAGILLEGVNQAPHRFGLAIGIGVNLATAPEASELEPLALPPVSLAENCGVSISPALFLEHLAKHYAVYEEQLCTHGFAAIRRAWLARAARVGQRITARLPQEDITGVFETIDDAGCMILQTPQGSRKIAAGDIYFEREMIHASGD